MNKGWMVLQRSACAVLNAPSLLFVALIAVYLAGQNVVNIARGADEVDLAWSLERGATPERGDLAKFRKQEEGSAVPCGDALSRARVTVALASLFEADLDNHIQDVSDDLGPAFEAAEARLKCSPLDGNAWLQWSKLQLRASGPIPPVLEGLKRSALFAPSESWILVPRLDIEARLSTAGIGELDFHYIADLRQFVDFEGTGAVASAYVRHEDAVRQKMRPLIETQSRGRRKAIGAEIDRLGVNFAKS